MVAGGLASSYGTDFDFLTDVRKVIGTRRWFLFWEVFR
jgi:hypothetical protein